MGYVVYKANQNFMNAFKTWMIEGMDITPKFRADDEPGYLKEYFEAMDINHDEGVTMEEWTEFHETKKKWFAAQHAKK